MKAQTYQRMILIFAVLTATAAFAVAGGLFPANLPVSQWSEFSAEGFSQPVTGVIYRSVNPPCCGMSLGAVDTGCIDLDVRGSYGFSCIFNPESMMPFRQGWRMPRKLPNPEPLLGISVGDQTWVLASKEMISGGTIQWCTEPDLGGRWSAGDYHPHQVNVPKIDGVQPTDDIEYWGHYPVADLKYKTTCPVQVSLRAWAPFLPGDSTGSNSPYAVFEVHLRNDSKQAQKGTLAFNFPGPDSQEALSVEFTRRYIKEDFEGLMVSSAGGVNYTLGVIGQEKVRWGGGLCENPLSWSQIATQLPQPLAREANGSKTYEDASCSAAVDFELEPAGKKVVCFLLSWYAPVWKGAYTANPVMEDQRMGVRWMASKWAGSQNYYTHMYAARFRSSLEVARYVAERHEAVLGKILAWQNVIYGDKKLPGWLKDSLINNLHLIAEDSMWAQAKPPLGDWAFPQGAFALNESPRGCPDLACIPCDWYGNLPIVYFYPDLAYSTLKIFKQYQREDGAAPFWLGLMGELPDLATPAYNWQISLNGFCYVDMISRLWLRTGDDAMLREFYESARKCNTMSMNLSSAKIGAVISMPDAGGMEWFEHGEWAGMATHAGALRLAGLKMMENMAQAMGDDGYVKQCQAWYKSGSEAMEKYLWNDSYYLNFNDLPNNNKSDDVMGYQLDGQWAALFHGQPGVFKTDRVKKTLDTIKKFNVALTPDVGAANFTRADGRPMTSPHEKGQAKETVEYYGAYTMFCAEAVVLGMTYMYEGDYNFGLDLVKKHWQNLVCTQRHPWDMPNMVDGKTGKRAFGTDYYQCMMLWAMPAAIELTDIKTATQTGSLVDRIIAAARLK